MTQPLGAVTRLHLGAEQLLHDFRAARQISDPLDDAVEGARLDHLPERELEIEGREIVLQRDQLLAARRFVDAVHDRRLLRLQRAGGGDVGGDHEVLDQAVRLEPVARGDRGDAALLVEHHAALGNVELERFALVPGCEERTPCTPERLESGAYQLGRNRAFDFRHRAGRRGDVAPRLSRRVDRSLCIFVGNVCGDANLRSCKSPALEAAVLRDLQVAGHRRPHLPFLQASRCRRTVPPEASAPRGRGSRRCCRAPSPRGRARSRGGRRS